MNEWNKLCEECSSLIKESKITDEDIDEIVRECRI